MRMLIKFFWLLVIRDLERQLHDQRTLLRTTESTDEFQRIYLASNETRIELAAARSAYSALLPVGQRKTWTAA